MGVPQAREEDAGYGDAAAGGEAEVPYDEGDDDENDFDDDVRYADVVDEFHEVDTLPLEKVPRTGEVARKCRDEDAGHGPQSRKDGEAERRAFGRVAR